jgi:hypothetical protein
MTLEQQLEASQNRRMANEHRFLVRMEKREKQVAPLIGELCREGKRVFYINLRTSKGVMTGRTKESASEHNLIDYLIRNNY